MKVIGIDPGKDGFICLLDGEEVLSWPTPTINISKKGNKRGYLVPEMRRFLAVANPDFVVIEKQQAMPGMMKGGKMVKQGVASSFATGQGYGLWEGLVAGLGLKYILVHPRTWQKVCHRDVQGDNTKARSILAAGRLFPNVDLRKNDKCRVPHDGKADALLLAWYGRYVSFGEASDRIANTTEGEPSDEKHKAPTEITARS